MAKPNYKNSLWARFSTWFSHLDLSDKIGVVLIGLTGIGFLAMLFKGQLKDPFKFPMAEAGKVPGKNTASGSLKGLKGCEGFMGSLPSPGEPLAQVYLAELHDHDTVVSCVNAIVKSRGNPRHRIVVETVPLDEKISCAEEVQVTGYGDKKGRECRGWDSKEASELAKKSSLYEAALDSLGSFHSELRKQAVAVGPNEVKLAIADLESSYQVNAGLCQALKKTSQSISEFYQSFYQQVPCFLRAQFQILRNATALSGFKAAYAQQVRGLEKELSATQAAIAAPSLWTERNRGLVSAGAKAMDTPDTLTFFVAGACHLESCDGAPGGEKVKKSIQTHAQKKKLRVAMLISKAARQYIDEGNAQMRGL